MNTKNAAAPCLHVFPLWGLLLAASLGVVCSRAEAAPGRPNIVFILCDDIAMGDLGCFGQTKIKTPNIDRMAEQGTRFSHLYTGTSVCAPSRCSLMTGLHMGHAAVRANREVQPEGQMPLPQGTFTVAELLQRAGYATACMGKWGLGMFDTTGSPLKLGFDHSLGMRGNKRTMYEGGLRQGGVVRWPGTVPAGKVSGYPWAFWDFLPTAAELAGVSVPDGVKVDGLSVVPALTGGRGLEREYFYWELHEPNFMQALRSGDWKVVRPSLSSPVELYNLADDPGERDDLSARQPDLVKRLTALMASARVDSPAWPPKDKGQKGAKPVWRGPRGQRRSLSVQ
jgi:arylsulfatase A-like enzyme